MNAALWSVLRLWVRYRRGRVPLASMPDPVWYFAYGGNMSERVFVQRRGIEPAETRIGRLDGYRLVFTVAGGMRPGLSAPANIIEAPGQAVHGVLYRQPLRQFVRLDAGEGRQYNYLWTEVEDAGGKRLAVVTYKVAQAAPEGRPGRSYLNTVREAARQRGLPDDYIAFLDRVEARE
ncbi:gamma-glutamylcyclotransferase family protein [Mesorhizobium sp.]|uniref:gamma-glutamylcyclotransferase family protein n=1 Tax=Mesorhizobium sp. TaxID=1871066 RepID=UPI000FE8DDA5|nr:gamma-glutamylcyclotransferase family protein [Mesorhizobium sp.]RWI36109.1 MAG: gamma-glutamylcyclotransferase [Mesorhizobium sp.]